MWNLLLHSRRTVRRWLTLSLRALSLEQRVEQVDVFSLELEPVLCSEGPSRLWQLPEPEVKVPFTLAVCGKPAAASAPRRSGTPYHLCKVA